MALIFVFKLSLIRSPINSDFYHISQLSPLSESVYSITEGLMCLRISSGNYTHVEILTGNS